LDTFNEQALTTTHEDIMGNLRNKWNPIYQAVEKKILWFKYNPECKIKGNSCYATKRRWK
jgi:hypothetical protein